jgi:hypothetical protein
VSVDELPFVWSAEEMVEQCAWLGVDWDEDTLSCAISRVGRNESPALILDLWQSGVLEQVHLLPFGINDAWCSSERPLSQLDWPLWLGLLEDAGIVKGATWLDAGRVRKVRHKRPLRLYRGAPADWRLGPSWTSSLSVAETFATGRLRGRHLGTVWTAEVEPSRLLARITGRDEDEYLIDTEGLEVSELPTQRRVMSA